MTKRIVKEFTGTDAQGNLVKFKQDEDGGKQFRSYDRERPDGVEKVVEYNYPPPSPYDDDDD